MDWPMKLQRRASNEKQQKPTKSHTPPPKADKKAPVASDAYGLRLRIESPPLVNFGPPEDSSGSLLSGILDLSPGKTNVTNGTFDVARLEMKLVMEVTTRRPIGANCPACATQSKVLHTWVFIPTTRSLSTDKAYGFPFSFLLPGNLPATTRSSLASVSYKLVAEANPGTGNLNFQGHHNLAIPPPLHIKPSQTPIDHRHRDSQPSRSQHSQNPSTSPHQIITGTERPPSPKTSTSKVVTLSQSLHLSRSILPAVEPRHSQRIFPPTSLSASLTLPTAIYPGASDTVDVTISGLNISEKLRWSLRKITWRLDEIAKVVSPACAIHAHKVGGQEGKGILYEDTRTVGAGDVKSGWKTDYSAGKLESVLQVGSAVQAMAACEVEAMSGVHVSHNLVIECVVAEEMLHAAIGPPRRGGSYQPTGNARVLRMSFPMIVTERGGMGISWDEEIPPRYEDVAWNVPPSFAQSEGSAVAARRDSMEGIEAVEGIRRDNTHSPAMFSSFQTYHRQPGSPSTSAPLARTDSNVSTGSDRRI